MNKKGFTLIELITTFALAIVIIILLINIIIVIKNIYSKNDVKSELIIQQSNLSHLINKKFNEIYLKTYNTCSDADFCYIFEFINGTTSKLVVSDELIQFDNYVYKISEGTTIERPTMERVDTLEVSSGATYNGILVIKIPVKHKLYPNEDFGLNIVYQYNSNETTLE